MTSLGVRPRLPDFLYRIRSRLSTAISSLIQVRAVDPPLLLERCSLHSGFRQALAVANLDCVALAKRCSGGKQFDILVPGSEQTKGMVSHSLAMGEYTDADGYKVGIGLHARGSFLDLMERYKVGPDLIEDEPDIGKVAVWAHK